MEKTRIVSIPSQIKSFAAMFLDDPHRAGRYYATLRKLHESELFVESDKPESYYTSAFAAYRLEYLFRNNLLDVKYKPVRWHALMAMRILSSGSLSVPPKNSRAMLILSNKLNAEMWDAEKACILFTEACRLIESAFAALGRPMDRDSARGQESTEAVITAIRVRLASDAVASKSIFASPNG